MKARNPTMRFVEHLMLRRDDCKDPSWVHVQIYWTVLTFYRRCSYDKKLDIVSRSPGIPCTQYIE